ncbi:MAG: ribosome recycling factor [Candidatus Komeilibacteria bacterium RIFOXYC1_FULL_37_11]|uniref:Ribosome-recycling factor n=1 Tax=Candidatus Komeilibacteria bacterium RIFOXYC1_FULL_37_11 TaxID=1798555 RepID=A0A1G2BYQ9_9BACT|nr:MAG: ribosome recycling factor [Candidatus Komeilibacteria bacterium RIFOXYC1_FULL_37_11]OGY95562.1 MAG: ribosome recycling factor [Candidatus Komeilibacteria bacterium RIFOXYD1_FULL_37_29]
MNNLIEKNKEQFEKTIRFFQEDISSLRTGRISPSLVEKVLVESYGTTTELLQLASITSPEPQSIAIKPWDKSILAAIEKALNKADLNVNPVVDGDLVRLNFPQLTEESRKELVKVLHKKVEESRIKLRGNREKVKEEVISLEKSKQISEDEKFDALESLDELVKEYNEKIKQISDKKEQEIMKI